MAPEPNLSDKVAALLARLPQNATDLTRDQRDEVLLLRRLVDHEQEQVDAWIRFRSGDQRVWVRRGLDVERADAVLWRWEKRSGFLAVKREHGLVVSDTEPEPRFIEDVDGGVSVVRQPASQEGE